MIALTGQTPRGAAPGDEPGRTAGNFIWAGRERNPNSHGHIATRGLHRDDAALASLSLPLSWIQPLQIFNILFSSRLSAEKGSHIETTLI